MPERQRPPDDLCPDWSHSMGHPVLVLGPGGDFATAYDDVNGRLVADSSVIARRVPSISDAPARDDALARVRGEVALNLSSLTALGCWLDEQRRSIQAASRLAPGGHERPTAPGRPRCQAGRSDSIERIA